MLAVNKEVMLLKYAHRLKRFVVIVRLSAAKAWFVLSVVLSPVISSAKDNLVDF